MCGHVGETARVQQEPSPSLDRLCDIVETCSVAHRVTATRGIGGGVPMMTNLFVSSIEALPAVLRSAVEGR